MFHDTRLRLVIKISIIDKSAFMQEEDVVFQF